MRQPDDDRPAMAAADQLLDKLLPSAFNVFQDSKFREAAGFDKLDQAEHDRIFNELEVAGMCLAIFCLEKREMIIGQKDFHFWRVVTEQIPVQFEKKLIELGADKENARLFSGLIKMRHDEYEKISDENFEYFEKHKDFKKVGTSEARVVLAQIHSISVGTANHILRGKLKQGHSLLRILRSWLFPLSMEITKFIRKL